MRTTTAYFAGAGTVIAAIVGGVGGGLLIADMVSPKSPKVEMTRLEQRMSAQPIRAEAAPQETVPVPYLAAPSSGTGANVAPAQPAQAPGQATHEAANPAPAAAPAETVAAAQAAVPATQAQTATQPQTQPSQPAVQKPAAGVSEPQKQLAAEDAQAKAKEDDIKRATVERRKVERRERWAERRRQVRRPDPELLEVEQKVRDETEPRALFAAEPARTQMPRIRLFDADQD